MIHLRRPNLKRVRQKQSDEGGGGLARVLEVESLRKKIGFASWPDIILRKDINILLIKNLVFDSDFR